MPALPPPPAPAAHAPAAVQSAPPEIRFGFDDAWLGETLAQWRASRPARVREPCAAPGKDPDILTCRDAPRDFGAGYAARELTYTFVQGRLAQITFRTSVDGFDHVTAALKRAFGTPDTIVRDSLGRTGFPHVSMTWRNSRSTIVLSDPLPDFSHLGVRFTLDLLANRLAKAG
jgi:hypothetical protein